MPNLSGGQGYFSTVLTANTAGTQLGYCGIAAATTATGKAIAGFLHTITIGADTTANTITVYDGTSTSGTVIAKIVTPTAAVPQTFTFDVQAFVGLFIVVAGGTTPTVNVSYG